MTKTAYLDETKRRNHYVLCCVVVAQSDVSPVRRQVARVKGGYRTIHMKVRNEEERLIYAKALSQMPVQGLIISTRQRSDRSARDHLFEELVPHLRELGVIRLVIESCGQDHEDRRALQRLLGPNPPMSYEHADKSDPMLALPDILGWSHGRGGAFREAVKAITTDLGRR